MTYCTHISEYHTVTYRYVQLLCELKKNEHIISLCHNKNLYRARDIALRYKHLPAKHKVLSSTHGIKKKKSLSVFALLVEIKFYSILKLFSLAFV